MEKERSTRVDIAYIISHGFAARMVLQTGLLSMLSAKGYKVCLISPDAEDENLQLISSQSDVQLVQYEESLNRWAKEFIGLRPYLFEDIRNNNALWEKHKKAALNRSRNPWRRIKPHLYLGLHKLVRRNKTLKELFRNIEKTSLNSKRAAKLLADLNPGLIVSTYPVNHTEAVLLHNAEKLNIKKVIHLLSWDNITCKGRFPSDADEYIAWGPIMGKELQEYYNIPTKLIHECGVPHFDLHYQTIQHPAREEYIEALNLDSAKPYLFFAMSSPWFAPHEIDIVEWLSEMINKAEFGEDMQMIIRPHPQNVVGNMADSSWLPRLKAITSGRVAVDYPSLSQSRIPWSMQKQDMTRLSQILHGAVVCINSGSTMSIDALMVKTPVVLSSFDGNAELPYWTSARRLIDFLHLKKFIDQGGIPVTKTFDELKLQIQQFIDQPSYLQKEREFTRSQECGRNDGKATERVVDVLIRIVKNIKSSV